MEYSKKNNIINELECIWISTNLVENKLCNNNFDCDNCAFNREMKNLKHQKELCENIYHYSEQNVLENIIERLNKLKSIIFPPQYIFNSCFVLKKFLGTTYFLGFNPVIIVLLDNSTESKLIGSAQVFRKGDKFIKLIGDWGEVDILAPFDFSIESEILPLSLNSENGKWLGFIKSANGNFELMKSNKDYFEKTIENVCGSLRRYIRKYVTVGITMYDGGEKLKYIYQVIGKENYIKIIKQFIS